MWGLNHRFHVTNPFYFGVLVLWYTPLGNEAVMPTMAHTQSISVGCGSRHDELAAYRVARRGSRGMFRIAMPLARMLLSPVHQADDVFSVDVSTWLLVVYDTCLSS